MPRPATNHALWAAMTPAQKSEAVRSGEATLRQMVEGLLDGPEDLRRTCRHFLAHIDASLAKLTDAQISLPGDETLACTESDSSDFVAAIEADNAKESTAKRRRLGLPLGYRPKLNQRIR